MYATKLNFTRNKPVVYAEVNLKYHWRMLERTLQICIGLDYSRISITHDANTLVLLHSQKQRTSHEEVLTKPPHELVQIISERRAMLLHIT